MKKLILLSIFLFGINFTFAQENFDISTLRIGDFTINMKEKAAEKISKSKLISFTGENAYLQTNKVNYGGEIIEIMVTQSYDEQGQYDGGYQIYSLMTKSKKFRTKSKMGVGSTKNELFESYKNYPNFSVNQSWEEKTEKMSKTKSILSLQDNDAGTFLSFIMENEVVTEVSVSINEGC